MRPSLLLADEPTGNLDAATGEQIMSLLADLHRGGLTIVLVTHDPLIGARAGRHITLRDGCIVRDEAHLSMGTTSRSPSTSALRSTKEMIS